MRHEHAAEGPASGNPVRPAVHAGAEAAAPAERQIVCANHGELPRHVKLSEAFFSFERSGLRTSMDCAFSAVTCSSVFATV